MAFTAMPWVISCVPTEVVAKVSREEVARKFFSPPPEKHLQILLEQGKITD